MLQQPGGRAPTVGSGAATVPSQSLLAGPASPGAGSAAGSATGIYSLQGVYFNRKQFSSMADCLTAASAQGLPLEICR
jgi:hypothetical protein